MPSHIILNGRRIGSGEPVYIIAELSANHGQSFDHAVEIIHAMKESGADAVKLQTYTPDTMTIDCDNEYFCIGEGTIWEGKNLYDLYREAYTPWEWQPQLKEEAEKLGMDCFSTPFDATAVDFLEEMDVPAYKIASFELVDLPLIEKVASTGKPMIISTGMGSKEEIQDAITAAREVGNDQMALLKCTSAYPAKPEEMHLRTIEDMKNRWNVPVGLSDHTLGTEVPRVAVRLGACVIEKHFTLSRAEGGPDSAFSLEPHEFREMVQAIREEEQSPPHNEPDERILGSVQYGASGDDAKSQQFRRSLFVVRDVREGERLTQENIRCIRPGNGLAPKYFNQILGSVATTDLTRGMPLTWECIDQEPATPDS